MEEIERLVMAHEGICGVHDLVVHDYGPGRRMISLHAEVPASGDILEMHDLVDNIEQELSKTLGCQAVIHMDPILTDDAQTNELRARVAALVRGIDEQATIHDFRIVTGPTHTNLIFDAVRPFDGKMTNQEMTARIREAVRALPGSYYAIVKVENPYT